MSAAPEGTAAVLAELRRAFDGSFAAPPADGREVPEKLLALRLGTDSFAVRVAELRGFERLRHVVALPGANADLLGLAGIRGTLVPVYSLALVMGYPAESEHRWLLLSGSEETIGLAFASFEGHFEAPRSLFVGAGGEGRSHPHVRDLLQAGSAEKGSNAQAIRAVVDVPSVLTALSTRAGRADPAKE